jgi:hypothetical protein
LVFIAAPSSFFLQGNDRKGGSEAVRPALAEPTGTRCRRRYRGRLPCPPLAPRRCASAS